MPSQLSLPMEAPHNGDGVPPNYVAMAEACLRTRRKPMQMKLDFERHQLALFAD